MGQSGVLGVELRPLVGLGRQGVQLGQQPLQALAFAPHRLLVGVRARQCSPGIAPAGPGRLQRGVVDTGLRIEQCAHGRWPGQALPGVLPVDLDEVIGQLAQLRHRGHTTVDPGPAAPLRIDHAAQHQAFVATVEARLRQPGLHRGRQVEIGHHLGAGCAFPHGAGVGTTAQRQLQGIDQDGLARAGLACEHGEAGAELDLERPHDRVVLQHQAPEHCVAPSCTGLYTTSWYQRSLRRSVA